MATTSWRASQSKPLSRKFARVGATNSRSFATLARSMLGEGGDHLADLRGGRAVHRTVHGERRAEAVAGGFSGHPRVQGDDVVAHQVARRVAGEQGERIGRIGIGAWCGRSGAARRRAFCSAHNAWYWGMTTDQSKTSRARSRACSPWRRRSSGSTTRAAIAASASARSTAVYCPAAPM